MSVRRALVFAGKPIILDEVVISAALVPGLTMEKIQESKAQSTVFRNQLRHAHDPRGKRLRARCLPTTCNHAVEGEEEHAAALCRPASPSPTATSQWSGGAGCA